MKANEFVKKFGWDVSTKLSREMKGITESVADGVAGWGRSEWDKLKRLVGSHELVESFGGLEMAKESLKNLPSEYQSYTMTRDDTGATTQSFKLNQAIADVESCQ